MEWIFIHHNINDDMCVGLCLCDTTWGSGSYHHNDPEGLFWVYDYQTIYVLLYMNKKEKFAKRGL